jgi:hypothetical protein
MTPPEIGAVTSGKRTGSQVSDGIPVLAAAHRRSVRAFDGIELRSQESPSVGAIHPIAARDLIRGSRFDPFYMRTIGWFVLDPMGPSDFEPLRAIRFIPEAFDHGEYSTSFETWEGVPCVKAVGNLKTALSSQQTIIEPDELWLSIAHGYCLVHRRVQTDTGVYQIDAREPVQIAPGCWIPTVCTITEQPTTGKPSVTILRVTSWSANDVDESMFKLVLRPGSMVADYTATLRENRPLREPVVRYVSDSGELLERPLKFLIAQRQARRRYVIYGVASGATVLLIILGLRRYRLRHRASRT